MAGSRCCDEVTHISNALHVCCVLRSRIVRHRTSDRDQLRQDLTSYQQQIESHQQQQTTWENEYADVEARLKNQQESV